MSKWVIGLAAAVGMAWVSGLAAAEPQKTEKKEKEDGLVAYWKFDEGSGTAVKDSAGSNDGKIVNAKWVDGKFGKALDFNGEDAYVEIPNAPALGLTKALSIEAWVKHRGTDFKQWEAIVCKGDHAYRLHFSSDDQSFDLGLNDGTDVKSGVKPDADKWYFVVATYDGKESKIYVDGKLAATGDDAPSEVADTDAAINIGQNSDQEGRFFNGVIDEVKIYNRALSADEVAAHFKRK
jgi:hypothetical protein